MVPGSTFRYGSHFCRVTLQPRLPRRQPIEEAATPFPREETTPPVKKIYFGAIRAACVLTQGLLALHRLDVHTLMFGTRSPVKSNSLCRKKRYFFCSGGGTVSLRTRLQCAVHQPVELVLACVAA